MKITISDGLLIFVTFMGPIVAVQLQKIIERGTDRRNRQMEIFHTLMATRAVRASSSDHVQALNLIELIFSGKSKTNHAVRMAWTEYRYFLSQPVPQNMSEPEAALYNDKGIDFLVNLLEAMGACLNFKFNRVALKRDGYYPRALADDFTTRNAIRDNLLKVVSGQQPLKTAIVPASSKAEDAQLQLQAALIEVFSGKAPIMVKAAVPSSPPNVVSRPGLNDLAAPAS